MKLLIYLNSKGNEFEIYIGKLQAYDLTSYHLTRKFDDINNL